MVDHADHVAQRDHTNKVQTLMVICDEQAVDLGLHKRLGHLKYVNKGE